MTPTQLTTPVLERAQDEEKHALATAIRSRIADCGRSIKGAFKARSFPAAASATPRQAPAARVTRTGVMSVLRRRRDAGPVTVSETLPPPARLPLPACESWSPEIAIPEIDVTGLTIPGGDIPEADIPEADIPELEMPEVETPELESPMTPAQIIEAAYNRFQQAEARLHAIAGTSHQHRASRPGPRLAPRPANLAPRLRRPQAPRRPHRNPAIDRWRQGVPSYEG